jgi:hypothetical protein
VPGGLLPEKKMKAVMIDMQLAEQIISENYQAYPDSASKAALFEAVFRKHGTTQAVYDSSIVWYGKNLNIMIQVLDLALKDIDGQITEQNNLHAAAVLAAKGDTANIWPEARSFTFRPDALFNGTIFELKPSVPFVSGSSFELAMSVWGLREDMTHKPEIRIVAEMQDTTITMNKVIPADGRHTITLRTIATKPTRRIFGHIIMDNAAANYYKIYVDSIRLVRYDYGASAN